MSTLFTKRGSLLFAAGLGWCNCVDEGVSQNASPTRFPSVADPRHMFGSCGSFFCIVNHLLFIFRHPFGIIFHFFWSQPLLAISSHWELVLIVNYSDTYRSGTKTLSSRLCATHSISFHRWTHSFLYPSCWLNHRVMDSHSFTAMIRAYSLSKAFLIDPPTELLIVCYCLILEFGLSDHCWERERRGGEKERLIIPMSRIMDWSYPNIWSDWSLITPPLTSFLARGMTPRSAQGFRWISHRKGSPARRSSRRWRGPFVCWFSSMHLGRWKASERLKPTAIAAVQGWYSRNAGYEVTTVLVGWVAFCWVGLVGCLIGWLAEWLVGPVHPWQSSPHVVLSVD